MDNNIKPYIKAHPVDTIVEEDYLSLIDSAGKTIEVGRLSGYSDNELVNPQITEDGYFQWFNPELDLIGDVLVSQNVTVDHVTTPVTSFGIYTGTVNAGFLKERLFPNNSFVLNGEYVSLIDEIAYNDRMEIETVSGVRCTVSSLSHASDRLANIFSETVHAGIHVGTATGAFVQIEFPNPLSIDGIILARNNSYSTRVVREIFTSNDGANWDGPILFNLPILNTAKFLDFNIDPNLEPEDAVPGVLFFEEPVVCKYIKIKNPDVQTSYNTLSYVMPFASIKKITNVRNHNYDDVILDSEVFEMTETENELNLELKEFNQNYDLTNSPSLTRQLCLRGDDPFYLRKDSILTFPETKEYLPGISSTLPYEYSGGGLTLEAGSYELTLECSLYSYDFRLPIHSSFGTVSTFAPIRVITAISKIPLTEKQVLMSIPYSLNEDEVTLTMTGGHTNHTPVNFLNPASVSTGTTTLSARIANTILVTIYDYKTPMKHEGFLIQLGANQSPFQCIKIEYSDDDGETWEIAVEKYETNEVVNSFHRLLFPSVIETKKIRLTCWFEDGGRRYGSIGRAYPLIQKTNKDYEPKQTLRFKFTLGAKTTIALETTDYNNAGVMQDRTLTVNKLGPNSLTEYVHTDAVTFPVVDATVSNNANATKAINKEGSSIELAAGSDVVVTFNSPVRLHRKGISNKLSNIGDLKLELLGDKIVDKSHLLFNPVLPKPEETIVDYNYRGISYSSTGQLDNIHALFDGHSQQSTTTYVHGNKTINFWFNELITVEGFFLTVPSSYPQRNGKVTDIPHTFHLQYIDPETEVWVDSIKVTTSTLDETGNALNKNGKRRFYKLPEKILSRSFRILTYGDFGYKFFRMSEVGVYDNPNNIDLSTFKTIDQRFNLGLEVRPFSEVIPAGTYRFTALGARSESVWYIEAVAE